MIQGIENTLRRLHRFAFAENIARFPVTKVDEKYLAEASERSYGQLLTDPDDRAPVFRWHLLQGEEIGLHWHPSAELIYMLRGRLKLTDGSVIGPGETVSYPPSLPHAVSALEDCEYFVVFQPGVYVDVKEFE